jgi:DNA-directed RNA polymerase subunit RPC12/RpoP
MALQFDTAVPSGTPASTCVACKRPIGDSYYTAGKAIVCESCKTRIETTPRPVTTPAHIVRATVFGIGGAIAGAAVYYGVLALIHLQIGLVAIVVGYLVGRAMQLGAGGQRGRPFQIIALILTYVGIALGLTAELVRLGGTVTLQTVITLPVIESFGDLPASFLTAIIIAVGLRQAWYMNRDPGRPTFQGPFRFTAQA